MNKLRSLRYEAGLTQEELARKAGLSLGGLRSLETGRRQPSLSTAQKIAAALGVTVDDIWPPNADDGPGAA